MQRYFIKIIDTFFTNIERKRARPNNKENSPVVQNEVTDDNNHNGTFKFFIFKSRKINEKNWFRFAGDVVEDEAPGPTIGPTYYGTIHSKEHSSSKASSSTQFSLGCLSNLIFCCIACLALISSASMYKIWWRSPVPVIYIQYQFPFERKQTKHLLWSCDDQIKEIFNKPNL